MGEKIIMYLIFNTKKEEFIVIKKAKNKHSRLFIEKDFIAYQNWFWFKISDRFRLIEINNYKELYNYSGYIAVKNVNQKEKIEYFIKWIKKNNVSVFKFINTPNVPPPYFLNSINFVEPIKID